MYIYSNKKEIKKKHVPTVYCTFLHALLHNGPRLVQVLQLGADLVHHYTRVRVLGLKTVDGKYTRDGKANGKQLELSAYMPGMDQR